MLRAVGRRLPAISGLTRNTTSPSSSLALVSSDALKDDTVISSANPPQGLQLLNPSWKSHFLFRGFSAESLAPRHELGFSDIPATIAAVKNPTSKIEYDESNHERFTPGDPSKRAFTYFVLTGGRFVYASFIRLMVLKFILSMSASKDVLAMASLEVDLSNIEAGSTVTVKWRGKPVFIRRRTEDDIQLANSVNVNSLRDPQEDSARVLNPEWLVVVGVCTHLGCVPLPKCWGLWRLVLSLSWISL
uniref:Cytochrome b-c1 complex subunit Rieske transmembrane domain-containing protein n=1 Tax=Picea sitchensis TaxID=3332 RepID=B8LMH0_PICSI|nr:unknown [Picea sitchensis]